MLRPRQLRVSTSRAVVDNFADGPNDSGSEVITSPSVMTVMPPESSSAGLSESGGIIAVICGRFAIVGCDEQDDNARPMISAKMMSGAVIGQR